MNANTQAWGNDTGLEQDRVKATGARSLREEFRWSVIEPADDRWDFSRYDRVVREAARRRMTVLPLLFHSPAWAAASTVTLPADEAKFADYVAHVVARYGAGGDFWDANPELADYAPTHFELWNEPYFKVFSATGADAGRYARLVRAAVTAGRAANPEAKYLIQADVTSTNDWVRYDEWIDAMYAAVPDLGKYFDAVAVHPYAGGDPNAWTPERPSSARWQTRRMDQILASFAAHGDRKPLQITEIGWSTCAAGCQTEAQQAEYMKKLFELVSTRYAGSVEAVYWYGWRDWGPADANKEHWFGMIARDGRQKPAYRAYQELTGVA